MFAVWRAAFELEAGVDVRGVVAHDDEVEVVAKVARVLVGLDGADEREEVELLAERHVDASKPAADRRRYRTFESDLVFANRGEHVLGERRSEFGDRGLAGLLDVPIELNAGEFEDSDCGVADLGTHAVARDESDRMPHSGPAGCGN